MLPISPVGQNVERPALIVETPVGPPAWRLPVSSCESDSRNSFKSLLISVYLLELVGAAAITVLGAVACDILRIDWGRSAPLWFAGYLFVYNADRLHLDPADHWNTPLRSSWSARLRVYRIILLWLSAGILGVWSLVTGRFWLVLPLAVAFGLLCYYSRPIPGSQFRFKDLPYLKSFLAPIIISVVLCFGPLWNRETSRVRKSV